MEPSIRNYINSGNVRGGTTEFLRLAFSTPEGLFYLFAISHYNIFNLASKKGIHIGRENSTDYYDETIMALYKDFIKDLPKDELQNIWKQSLIRFHQSQEIDNMIYMMANYLECYSEKKIHFILSKYFDF